MRAKEFFIRAGKLLSAVLFLSVGLSMVSQAMVPYTLKFPVKINVSGNAPETTYRVKMEADEKNPNAPLPSPSEISKVGAGNNQKHDVEFEITYAVATREGEDLIYKIRQTTEAANNLELSKDEYTVIVQVFEDDKNPGYLKAVYWVGKKDSETKSKSGEISFTNRYHRSPNPGGGGDTPPGGGGDTPPTPTPPNPTQPTPKIPEVQGEVRPFDPVKAIQKVPEVFGAIRKVATGDSSSMALYGLFAATSMCSLFFWGIGQKKKEKKA
ncbi:Spy0128 family protein [Oribacterium parvum]|uniref:Spy0128 family protein n=1 Tax=Oribacterium parvum TaxID=1501329 RepID=UPI0028EA8552|nr:FctA domain-containing protein [Oribacterium parvum]